MNVLGETLPENSGEKSLERPVDLGAICLSCARSMEPFRNRGSWPLIGGVYRYEGSVRDQIVATKARGGVAEFDVCKNLFINSSVSQDAADWCDVILAPPPSFWSRIRLRPHLGTELAFALGARYSKPVIRSVPPVFWRITKQAMKKRSDRIADGDPVKDVPSRFTFNACLTGLQRILVVDDVQTSGQTLRALQQNAARFAPDSNMRTLVMAGSRPAEHLRSLS